MYGGGELANSAKRPEAGWKDPHGSHAGGVGASPFDGSQHQDRLLALTGAQRGGQEQSADLGLTIGSNRAQGLGQGLPILQTHCQGSCLNPAERLTKRNDGITGGCLILRL